MRCSRKAAPHSAPAILKAIPTMRAWRDRDGFSVNKGFARDAASYRRQSIGVNFNRRRSISSRSRSAYCRADSPTKR